MATKTDISRQLSVKQENAIDLLVLGKTDTEIAQAVGVTRQTVNEWRNHDPVFIAELNHRRSELWQAGQSHLRSLMDKAVAVIEEDLNGDEPRLRQLAAVHVLKALGIYGQKMASFGPTTPEGVENERRRIEKWTDLIGN